MAGSKECVRIILWMSWVTHTLITSVYILLAVITFDKLWQASTDATFDITARFMDKIWRAPLTALFLSALLVLGFDLLSCIILIKKSVNKRGGVGFGYGFITAMCFTLGFLLLLVALVLGSFTDTVKTTLATQSGWSSTDTQLYQATTVFGFVACVMFTLFFFALVFFQSAVTEQLGIAKDMNNPYATLEQPQPIPVPGGWNGQDYSMDPAYQAYYQNAEYGTGYGFQAQTEEEAAAQAQYYAQNGGYAPTEEGQASQAPQYNEQYHLYYSQQMHGVTPAAIEANETTSLHTGPSSSHV